MMINYISCDYQLELNSPVKMTIPPTFLFRSLIGKELKYISCVFKDKKCSECNLNFKCAYSYIFENPINPNNPYLLGRTNTTPPYVISTKDVYGTTVKSLNVKILLIGEAMSYQPYLSLALERAGEEGILKERTKFQIKSATKSDTLQYTFYKYNDVKYRKLRIDFLTPFRYKKDNSYVSKISFADVLKACTRRLNILSNFYGDKGLIIEFDNVIVNERVNLIWKEYTHYSSRQKESMQLGGVIGYAEVEGNISDSVVNVLKGGKIFHIGKSISFGLGAIKITEEL